MRKPLFSYRKQPSSDSRNQLIRGQLFLFIGILILIAVQAIARPGSVSFGQMMNVSRQAAGLGIVVLGQTIVIISGGIDLSVGSVVTLTNVMSVAYMSGQNENTLKAILICLLYGLIIGVVNAAGVVLLNIAPFVMTLCTMSIVQGVYLVFTGGSPTGNVSPFLKQLGNGSLAGIPYSTIVWFMLVIVIGILLHKTRLGRYFFSTGNNPAASSLAGVAVKKVQALAYVICSLLAVIGGLVVSGYVGTTSLGLGADYLTNSLAAVLIGGTAIEGGSGGVVGGALGAFFLMLIFALMTMLSLGQAAKLIVQSLIIILVVALQRYERRN